MASQEGCVFKENSPSVLRVRDALAGSAEAGALLWFGLLGCYRHAVPECASLLTLRSLDVTTDVFFFFLTEPFSITRVIGSVAR